MTDITTPLAAFLKEVYRFFTYGFRAARCEYCAQDRDYIGVSCHEDWHETEPTSDLSTLITDL